MTCGAGLVCEVDGVCGVGLVRGVDCACEVVRQ